MVSNSTTKVRVLFEIWLIENNEPLNTMVVVRKCGNAPFRSRIFCEVSVRLIVHMDELLMSFTKTNVLAYVTFGSSRNDQIVGVHGVP